MFFGGVSTFLFGLALAGLALFLIELPSLFCFGVKREHCLLVFAVGVLTALIFFGWATSDKFLPSLFCFGVKGEYCLLGFAVGVLTALIFFGWATSDKSSM